MTEPKLIKYTYTPNEFADEDAELTAADELVDQIRILSGILFRIIDGAGDRLESKDVDLEAAWKVLQDLWDANYLVKRSDE